MKKIFIKAKTNLKRKIIRFQDNSIFYFSRWIFFGVLIGIVAGIGAIVFNSLIRLFRFIFQVSLAHYYSPRSELLGQTGAPPNAAVIHWVIPLVIAAGGLISGLLVYTFAPEAEGHGTDAAIDAFHNKNGFIRGRVPVIKMLASAVTLGSGGSGGREGPVAQIGAGFGSVLATYLGLPIPDRRTMLVAGIGAGIGAIFKSPLAGAMFGVEVLYSEMDFEGGALMLSIIAAIVGYSIYAYFYAGFSPVVLTPMFTYSRPVILIFYAVLGIFLAFMGNFYIRFFYWVHGIFKKIRIKPHFKPMLGGALVGIIAYFFPEIMGVGYGWLQLAVLGKLTIITLILLGFFKIVATSFTISSGGSAGVYAPSLVIGGAFGGAIGGIFHILFPQLILASDIAPFVLIGMGGFFAGAAKTPISSLLMVSEMTGSYGLLPPLMLVSAITFVASGKRSIYSKQKRNRMESPAHFKDYLIKPLQRYSVKDVMEEGSAAKPIAPDMPLYEMIKIFFNSNFFMHPVIDKTGKIVGTIKYDKIKNIMLTSPDDSRLAKDIMDSSFIPRIRITDTLDIAVHSFFRKNTDELIVINEDGNYEGILRKRDVVLTIEGGQKI
ncbi:MAG: chloride channel protein [Deltaproteobacteria bacterium]|nr:chloride channel protein [Deltaproteobacteria bacterium]MCL5880679.1 chloride channel protein [Deltaproteobacteria bacterium]MDA8305190.1 chloride channel protein [Deltaproteobacteria bacterium]